MISIKEIMKVFSLLLLSCCLLISTQLMSAEINGIRFWQDPEKTRVVLDLSDQVSYRVFTLANPSRLVIDIEDASLKVDLKKLTKPNKLVKGVRDSFKNKILRVVFDLDKKVSSNDFLLKPYQKYGHRLVVDLRSRTSVKKVTKTIGQYVTSNNRDIVIAIDAGHGGEDPGASGSKGTREKSITLKVAKILASKINQLNGYKAILTRSGDFYVGLVKRTQIARKKKADLFISIHADGFNDPKVKGASVWVLSTKGANSEMGRWLEERERSSDLLGGVENLSNIDPLVAQVLLDLSMHYSTGESQKFATIVKSELTNQLKKMHGKNIRKANFAVLRMPDIPAVLVELAFISNPSEERLLKTKRYQNKLANAILKGVVDYFKNNAPDGSLVAQLGKAKTYKVKSGDTLSAIAQKYSVTLNQLRLFNELKNDRIRIKQIIKIPPIS